MIHCGEEPRGFRVAGASGKPAISEKTLSLFPGKAPRGAENLLRSEFEQIKPDFLTERPAAASFNYPVIISAVALTAARLR